MNKYILLLLFCIPFGLQAQIQKSFHQVYEISDSVKTIELKLVGEYKYESWVGNTIMLQTKIVLYDATDAILKFFMENGRYKVVALPEGTKLILNAKDQERRVIKSSGIECYEVVEQTIFLPEEFMNLTDGIFSKVIVEEEESGNND
jgi:hypothetical protein